MKRTIILTLALAFCLFLFLDQVDAEGQPTYLGDVCFSMDSGFPDTPPYFLRLAVLSYGPGHYVLDGAITGITFGGDEHVSGTAALAANNKIIISLYYTEAYSFDIYHITLDPSTLSGSYTSKGFNFSLGQTGATAQPFMFTERSIAGGACP